VWNTWGVFRPLKLFVQRSLKLILYYSRWLITYCEFLSVKLVYPMFSISIHPLKNHCFASSMFAITCIIYFDSGNFIACDLSRGLSFQSLYCYRYSKSLQSGWWQYLRNIVHNFVAGIPHLLFLVSSSVWESSFLCNSVHQQTYTK